MTNFNDIKVGNLVVIDNGTNILGVLATHQKCIIVRKLDSDSYKDNITLHNNHKIEDVLKTNKELIDKYPEYFI